MALATLVVFLVVGLFAVVPLASAVHTVEQGTVEVLLVFGEMQAVLEPGLNVVFPCVSTTDPVDPAMVTMITAADRVPIPTEFEEDVREHQLPTLRESNELNMNVTEK